jgi:DNA-binding NtrC family response regulator
LDLKTKHGLPQELLERFRHVVLSKVRSVIMADYDMRPAVVELVKLGASDYCSRRTSIRDIEVLLRKAHETSTIKSESSNGFSRVDGVGRFGQMVGSSAQIQQVYRLVSSVANTGASVLVTGESGTGKELIARAIHELSSRSDSPFVAVSAGAIPETLLEAELFGHEKGAFTGTVGARKGYLEEAGTGTLFLDEIGDLSLSAQVKLLRVLQQREFSRLGSSRIIPLRARFIFATHRNLEELVAQGLFREDLYYRINVFKISAPPLRDRKEDISQLAGHFLRKYSQMHQKSFKAIDPGALQALVNYSWPGNIRELENVIQKATIVGLGDTIQTEDLELNQRSGNSNSSGNIVCIGDYEPAGSFELQLRDFKIKLAEAAVRDNHGNKSQAARSLNISRAYLYRLIGLADEGLAHEENNAETTHFEQIAAYL